MKQNKYKNVASSVDDESDSDVEPNNGQPTQENDDPNAPYDYLGGFIIPVGTMLLFHCVGAMFLVGIYCIPYGLGWTDHLPWENPYACETQQAETIECRPPPGQPAAKTTEPNN